MAHEVFDAEGVLRRTLDAVFTRSLGEKWQDHLSSQARRDLQRTHEVAQRQRKDVPDDPWSAAGLNEIKGAVHSMFTNVLDPDYGPEDADIQLLRDGLADLGWVSREMCTADIARLSQARADTAHPAVAPPVAATQLAEAKAIAHRLRIGCEQVRRRLIQADEEWFPYIERITCPAIPEWQYERGGAEPEMARLNQGDEVEFIVTAVNTAGSTEQMRYGLSVQPDGGTFNTIIDDSGERRLVCRADPPGRAVTFAIHVRGVAGGHDAAGWDDTVTFMAAIRPDR